MNIHFNLPSVYRPKASPELKSFRESEVKSSCEPCHRKLEEAESKMLDSILHQQTNSLSSNKWNVSNNLLSYSPKSVISFVTKKLKEQKLIREAKCDIGGGVVRNVLAGMDYADIDVSYHVIDPNPGKIIEIIKQCCKEIIKSGEDSQKLFHAKHFKNKEGKEVGLFVSLGGVEFKFIFDETYRWHVASFDSLYISYPDCNLHCAEYGVVGDEAALDKCIADLKTRRFVIKNPQAVSDLILRILLAQTQGFEVYEGDIKIALRKFKEEYPTSDINRPINKILQYLSNHYRGQELPRMFAFLNFLELISKLDSQEDQAIYMEVFATAWLQRTYGMNAKRPFFKLAGIIQTEPELALTLLKVIHGVAQYEFLSGNPSVKAYVFDFDSKIVSRWQVGVNHGNSSYYLSVAEQNPDVFAIEFLKSWKLLREKGEETVTKCQEILSDLGFSKITFDSEGLQKVISRMVDAFDSQPLVDILAKFFPGVNPLRFYEFVTQEFPGVIDPAHMEYRKTLCLLRKRLDSVEDLDLASRRIITILRRALIINSGLRAQDLKEINQHLATASTIKQDALLQELIMNGLLDLVRKTKDPFSIDQLQELLNLIGFSEKVFCRAALKRIKEIREKILEEYNRLLVHVDEQPDQWSLIGKVFVELSPNLTSHSLNVLLDISERILSNSTGDNEELHQLAKKILLIISQKNQDAVLHQRIYKLLFKGMSSALTSNSKNSKNQYSAFLEVLSSMQNVKKMHHEHLSALNSVSNLDLQKDASNAVRIFVQNTMKIDKEAAQEILESLEKHQSEENEKQDVASGLIMSKILSSADEIFDLLQKGKDTSEQTIKLVTLLQSIADLVCKKDGQRMRKAIKELHQKLLGSSMAAAMPAACQLFEVIKKSEYLEAGQLDEMALGLLQHYVKNEETRKKEVMSAVFEHLCNECHFKGAGYAEVLPSILTLVSPGFDNLEALSLKVLLRALENSLWNKEIEQHCLNVFRIFNNKRELPKEVIGDVKKILKILIGNKALLNYSSKDHLLIFSNTVLNAMMRVPQFDLAFDEAALQLYIKYVDISHSGDTDALTNAVLQLMTKAFKKKIYSCSESQAVAVLASTNVLMMNQIGKEQVDINSINAACQIVRQFLKMDKKLKNYNLGQEIVAELEMLVTSASTLGNAIEVRSEIVRLVIESLPYMSKSFSKMKEDIYLPQLKECEDSIKEILRKPVLDDAKIGALLSEISENIIFYGAFDPEKGAETIKKVARRILSENPEWSKKVDQVLTLAIDEGIFARKTKPGKDFEEMEAKERAESNNDLICLQCEIVQKSCEAKQLSIFALTLLMRIFSKVDEFDVDMMDKVLNFALILSDRMLINIVYQCAGNDPSVFFKDFVEILLEENLPSPHRLLVIIFICNLLTRLEHYPVIFEMIAAEDAKLVPDLGSLEKGIMSEKTLKQHLMQIIQNLLKAKAISISSDNYYPTNPALRMIKRLEPQDFYKMISPETIKKIGTMEFELFQTFMKSPLFFKGLVDESVQSVIINMFLSMNDRMLTPAFTRHDVESYRNFISQILFKLCNLKFEDKTFLKSTMLILSQVFKRLLLCPSLICEVGKKADSSKKGQIQGEYIFSLLSNLNKEEILAAQSEESKKLSGKLVLEALDVCISSSLFAQVENKNVVKELFEQIKSDCKVFDEATQKEFVDELEKRKKRI